MMCESNTRTVHADYQKVTNEEAMYDYRFHNWQLKTRDDFASMDRRLWIDRSMIDTTTNGEQPDETRTGSNAAPIGESGSIINPSMPTGSGCGSPRHIQDINQSPVKKTVKATQIQDLSEDVIARRAAANRRERRRMHGMNKAFDRLRKRLPTLHYERRLPKAETLRIAIMYIRFMGDLLARTPAPIRTNSHPK